MGFLKDNWKRAFNPLAPELEKKIKTDIDRWDLSGKRKRANELATQQESYAGIEEKISNIPTYQVSPEAQRRLELLQQSGSDLTQSAQEVTDIARMRAGMMEAPGSGQALSDIRQSTASQTRAIQEAGGQGFLGTLQDIQLGERQALKDYATTGLAYKSGAETDLMRALRGQSQAEAQAAQLESQALEGMISEKDKVYQSELMKAQTGLQYDITKLGMEQQRKAAEEAGRSTFLGGIFG